MTGKPVRVVRGPKLASDHSTAQQSGGQGGYRYDGLYTIRTAKMVRTGPKQLQTCIFTLERVAGQPPLGVSESIAGRDAGTGTGDEAAQQGQGQGQEQESGAIIAAEPWVWCEQSWSGESNDVALGATVYMNSDASSAAPADGFAAGETCCCHCGWTMQAPLPAVAIRCANAKCRAVIRKRAAGGND